MLVALLAAIAAAARGTSQKNAPVGDERLERVAPGAARDELLPLLRLADDSATQVAAYYQHGDLFALRGTDGRARGMVLVQPGEAGSVELKSLAVAQPLHGRGVGRRMVELVLDELRAGGVRRVVVGTASCSIGALAFYQKAGFRLLSVERDYFNAQRGYPDGLAEHAIPLRDMVWMDQEL